MALYRLTFLAFFVAIPATRAALFQRVGDTLRKIDESQADSGLVDWSPLSLADKISGIGKLRVSFGFFERDICTAFAIDTGVDAGPAYLLSNAHCRFFEDFGWDSLGEEEVRTDQTTSYFVQFDHAEGRKGRVHLKLKTLKYITEFETDLAIYEMPITIAELKNRHGIQPLRLAPTAPKAGTEVTLVGVPLRTMPEKKQVLHKSRCRLGTEVALRNGSYRAPHSVRHQCSSIPGFSGGPLLNAAHAVVLINSHGSDDFSKQKDCSYATMPCEVDALGRESVDRAMNYGQYVHPIAGCFDSKGNFDLKNTGCGLKR